MIEFIRRYVTSIFLKIILGAIIIVFIFWGIGNFSSQRKNVVAKVNNVEIDAILVEKAYRKLYNHYQQLFRGNLPKEILDKIDLRRQALDQVVKMEVIQQSAKKLGIYITPEEIHQEITKFKEFHINDTFNKELYLKTLESVGITPIEFEEEIKQKLIIDKLRILLGTSIYITEDEIKNLYQYENEEITFSYIELTTNDIKDKIIVTSEDILKYYEKNKEKYKTEPKIKIRYIEFLNDDFIKEVNIKEEDIINYYEENKRNYYIPEKRKARHILVRLDQNATKEDVQNALNRANEILSRIKQGEDFEKLAMEVSDDRISAIRGGDLGFIEKGHVVKEFEDVLFKLKEGEVSNPLLSQFGWHIIKLDKILPESFIPLEQVKDSIKDHLTKERLDMIITQYVNNAYEDLIIYGNLNDYATKKGIEIKKSNLFTKSNPPEFLLDTNIEELFTLQKDVLSSPIKTKTGYIIAEISEKIESYIPELSEIEDKIKIDCENELKIEKLSNLAKDILETAKTKSLEEAIKIHLHPKKEIKSISSVKRRDIFSHQQVPAELLKKAFLLSTSNPLPEQPLKLDDKIFIYNLQNKSFPNLDDIPQDQKNRIRERLYQERIIEVFEKWLDDETKKAKITIYEKT